MVLMRRHHIYMCSAVSIAAVPWLLRLRLTKCGPLQAERLMATDRKSVVQGKTPLTKNQVRGFWAAWGGWALDGMDSFIYALVMVPALKELLPRSGIPGDQANVGYYGGLLFALFLVGWGLSVVWGPVADEFGRVRTL